MSSDVKFRILRKKVWGYRPSERIGGRGSEVLNTVDVLQYLAPSKNSFTGQSEEGVWVDVPVVEGETPLSPSELARQEETARFERAMDELFSQNPDLVDKLSAVARDAFGEAKLKTGGTYYEDDKAAD